MRFTRFYLLELVLAVLFLGVFAALIATTWGSAFFIHGIAMSGVPLFMGYLILVIAMRQYREQRAGGRERPDA